MFRIAPSAQPPCPDAGRNRSLLLETLAVTLENDPEFVMGHIFNASAMLMMSERQYLPAVRDSIEKAEALAWKSNDREKDLVAAARRRDGQGGSPTPRRSSEVRRWPRRRVLSFSEARNCADAGVTPAKATRATDPTKASFFIMCSTYRMLRSIFSTACFSRSWRSSAHA